MVVASVLCVPRSPEDKPTLSDLDPCLQDDVLTLAQRGDALAFASLVRLHQRSVYSLAARMLADREQANDLAQEVFLQLYRKLASIESARHLTFWLRKVTSNLAIDRLRQQPQGVFASLDEDDEIAGVESDDDPLLQRQLGQLLSELAPTPRAVLLLRYQEDLDPLEIAKALDLPINTVKSHLKRSLAALRLKILSGEPVRRDFNVSQPI